MKPRTRQPRTGIGRRLSRGLRKQRGAAAIEAALLFVIFFTLFYAIVSYSLPLMMMQAFQHAAAEGARAAVAVDDPDSADYESRVENRVQDIVGESLNWLPSAAHKAVLEDGGGLRVDVDHDTRMLTVTVKFSDYTANPLIPILSFPGIGDVPRLPADLTAHATVQF